MKVGKEEHLVQFLDKDENVRIRYEIYKYRHYNIFAEHYLNNSQTNLKWRLEKIDSNDY